MARRPVSQYTVGKYYLSLITYQFKLVPGHYLAQWHFGMWMSQRCGVSRKPYLPHRPEIDEPRAVE